MRILIADDDPVVCSKLKQILVKKDHEVMAAADGAEAWDQYQSDPVKLVISDWIMPNLSGLELCEKIRTSDVPDYCYFILLTGNTSRRDYEEAMDGSVDDFLPKPIEATELLIRLRVAQRILESTARIKRLESLLPICSYCRRIRENDGAWLKLEAYMGKHADANFSHVVCPECLGSLDFDEP